MPVSTPHNAFNYLTENILFYSSALLAQTYSFIISGTGKFKAALLALKASFFTRTTAIFYTPPPLVIHPLQSQEIEALTEQKTLSTPPTLLSLPPEILYIISEKLGPRDKLSLLSTCTMPRNIYSSEQTTWLPFQIAHERLFGFLLSADKSLGCYRKLLLRLLDPETIDLERTAIFTEQFHSFLPYPNRQVRGYPSQHEIIEILEQVLQQPALDVPQQWKKLADVNLHLCVTLSGIVTMEKLAEYGVNRHFFSRYFPTDSAQLEAFLNRIKATKSYSALDCAIKEGFRQIAIALITHLTTSDCCIADALINAINEHDITTVNLFLENNVGMNLQDKDGWTALMAASRKEQQEIVQVLLNHGANVNLQDKNGWTALMAASRKGQQEIVQALLNHGANVNLQDKDGWTALMLASDKGKRENVQLLLEYGANANLQGKDGWTALAAAPRIGQQEIVQLLLDHDAHVDPQENAGWAALVEASEYGRLEIVQLLLNRGAHVNLQDKNGRTALMAASEYGKLEIVQLLLDYEADVNLQDKDGRTALMAASEFGRLEIAQLLFNRGAHVNLQDKDGGTALMAAFKYGQEKEEIVRLLLDRGAHVNRQDNNRRTALILASASKKQETVQRLLDQGANVNLQDEDGWTALVEASAYGSQETVQLLLDHGAHINQQEEGGKSALVEASRYGKLKTVQLLLDQDANINQQDKDKNGWTALTLACLIENKNLVELLLGRGAQITPETLSVAKKSRNNYILQLLRNTQQQATQET